MTCDIQHRSKIIVKGSQHGKGLYMLTDHASVKCINIACAAVMLDTWHQQLGHVNYTLIVKMAKKKLVTGMPTSLSYLPQICDHCVLAKQACTLVPKMQEGGRVKRLLEKVFSDITGPENVKTPHGELYTLNFIDDYSQKACIYIIKRKSEAYECFKDWRALVETETGQRIKIFQTDNGENVYALLLISETVPLQEPLKT